MLSMEDVELFLENIEGLLIIDSNERIVFMTKKLAKSCWIDQKEAIGKLVKEVIPVTKIDLALKTKEPYVGEFYFADGLTIVSNGAPLFKEGKLVGAIEYDVFEDAGFLHRFLKKVDELSSEINYYKQEIRKLRGAKYSIDNIIGKSEVMDKLRLDIRNAGKSNSTVLIQGETGCGKELVAHAIHNLSQRSLANFVRINCAAIPENLLESELFGYEEGTFSGARKGGKKGKFEIANGGTIFLDEIHHLPISIQPKLLRVLQEREVSKVGGDYSIPINVRIIAASNKDLLSLVKEEKFREDLYYRLNVFLIDIEPLRERIEDIPSLAEEIIKRTNDFLGTHIESVSEEVIIRLQSYDWPGNVRELQNVIERAMNICEGKHLDLEHFDTFISTNLIDTIDIDEDDIKPTIAPLMRAKKSAEKETIIRALKLCNGNKSKAAEVLHISRSFLYKKMKKLNIEYFDEYK